MIVIGSIGAILSSRRRASPAAPARSPARRWRRRQAQASPPPGFVDQPPFAKNWAKPLREVVQIDLSAAAPELASEAVQERHRVYCHLLMKLMVRFWNGNKRGPLGSYPRRVKQMEAVQPVQPTQRYRGDMIAGS